MERNYVTVILCIRLRHNVHNSGTNTPFGNSSTRLLPCGNEVANLWQRRSRVYEMVGVRLSQHGPHQQTLLLAEDISIDCCKAHRSAAVYSATIRYDTRCYFNVRSKANLRASSTARNRQLKSVKQKN